MPAQVEFSPHGRKNARTKRFLAARKQKVSAQIDFEGAQIDFWPHGNEKSTLQLDFEALQLDFRPSQVKKRRCRLI
jgi:hypothetical protein